MRLAWLAPRSFIVPIDHYIHSIDVGITAQNRLFLDFNGRHYFR